MKIESTTFLLDFGSFQIELDAAEVNYDVAEMWENAEASQETPQARDRAYKVALQSYLNIKSGESVTLSQVEVADRLIAAELDAFKKKLPSYPKQLEPLDAPPVNSPSQTSEFTSLSLGDLPRSMSSENVVPKGGLPPSGYDSLPMS